jgi:hypothetical protein
VLSTWIGLIVAALVFKALLPRVLPGPDVRSVPATPPVQPSEAV